MRQETVYTSEGFSELSGGDLELLDVGPRIPCAIGLDLHGLRIFFSFLSGTLASTRGNVHSSMMIYRAFYR